MTQERVVANLISVEGLKKIFSEHCDPLANEKWRSFLYPSFYIGHFLSISIKFI